jgi:hypothetical protein
VVSDAAPTAVLDVFRVFANEPVACTSEMFLFELGIFTFSGKPLIHVSLVRQLRTEQPDQLDPELWQVHCELLHEPTVSFAALGRFHLWSDPFAYGASNRAEGLSDFFDEVAASVGFAAALQLAQWRLEVWGDNPE